MRILLDECLPVDFRHDLAVAGVVETARYAGLDTLSNGALLDAMTSRYDVLITVDSGLRYQQSIVGRPVAVLVVKVPTNALLHLRPRAGAVIAALAGIKPGTIVEV
jgi:predicted nuclease of predicted toxin-antitoxin system